MIDGFPDIILVGGGRTRKSKKSKKSKKSSSEGEEAK